MQPKVNSDKNKRTNHFEGRWQVRINAEPNLRIRRKHMEKKVFIGTT